jgi:endonuclease/exonuclease/phosphatase (EEP) superfamily protein YafD
VDTPTPPSQQPPPSAPEQPPAARRHWLRRTFVAVANWFYANVLVVMFGPWLVGQVFRDHYHLTGLCLLIPSAVVAVALVAVALVAWLCACRRAALAAALLAIAPIIMILGVENHWRRPQIQAPEGKTLRLVNWNVWAGQHGWDEIIEQLLDQKADIYVLSEAYADVGVQILLDELGPSYSMERAHSMAVIARGSVIRPSSPRIRGRAYPFLCSIDGAPVRILVADLPSLPIIYRAPFLKQICFIVEKTKPDLIVGDFNAPRRSLLLSRLPEGYAHAYHLAGKGWSATWPAQLPLWAIDQCIVGPGLQAIRYDLLTSSVSDHRMQVLDFVVRKKE